MSIDDRSTDDEDLRAAEYVLGLLDADARREAEALLRRDARFADEVRRWEARFAMWLHAVAPVEAPLSAWSRIQAALWSSGLSERGASTQHVPFWQRLAVWRGLATGAIAATAVSVALIAFLLHESPRPAPGVVLTQPSRPAAASMTVSLRHGDGSIAYIAVQDTNGSLVLTPVQVDAGPRTPELWLIPVGGKPRSLGMLPRDRAIVVQVPAALRAAIRDGVFAISLEPPHSGPHEAPTGPVVAKGGMVSL